MALDSGTKKGMAARIEEVRGGEVVIDAQVDPAMIGGVRAKVGDMLIDGSISSRLESLRNSMVESNR
jgi:F-type H+-transporting ATPase subunit delta